MTGLLEGEIANAIYQGFKGKLLKGTLTRKIADEEVELDKLGDPKNTEPTVWQVEGFTDAYSRFTKATAGIPDTDLRVNIFAKSLPTGVRPEMDDVVYFNGEHYILRASIEVDPAGALWQCQASRTTVPEEVEE